MKNRKAAAMRFFHFFTLALLLICYLGPVSAEPTPLGSWLVREMGQDDFNFLEITEDAFSFEEFGGRSRRLDIVVSDISSGLFELRTKESQPGNMLMLVEAERGWLIMPQDSEGLDCFRRGPLLPHFIGSWTYFDPTGEGAHRQVEIGPDSFSYTFTDYEGEKEFSGELYPMVGRHEEQSAVFSYRNDQIASQSLIEFRPLPGGLLLTLKPKYGPERPLVLWKTGGEEPPWFKSYLPEE